MSSIIAAVRQIATGLGRRAEDRFCLIYELRLVGTNGFTFVPSVELTERDVIDRLTKAGYRVRDAFRLIEEARTFFARRLLTSADGAPSSPAIERALPVENQRKGG